MSDDMARVTKVRPTGGRALRVRFAGDRRERQLDLTGLIARSVHFAPLMDDAETFAKVAIVDGGLGVAWPVQTKWGRLDLSAATLRRIAEEQQPMTGADFARWRTSLRRAEPPKAVGAAAWPHRWPGGTTLRTAQARPRRDFVPDATKRGPRLARWPYERALAMMVSR